jgi:adenylyltransferase/sulfurtransferase
MDIGTYDLFSRQTPYLGLARQEKLSGAKVVVVGAGGLGSFVSSMLVRMGVGVVRIIDRDLVEESNLPRTILYKGRDAGKSKAFVASEKLAGINPRSRVDGVTDSLNDMSAENLLAGFDVVVDCTDNMDARFAINKFCVKSRVPWVYGTALRDEGFSSTFRPGGQPCFSCLYHGKTRKTEKTSEAGVIAPVVAMVASWQAMEVIKILTAISEPNYSRLFRIKLERPGFELLAIKPWEDCEVCGKDLLRR